MDSRQAQKSPPAPRPRSARWNACECAETNPGSWKRSSATWGRIVTLSPRSRETMTDVAPRGLHRQIPNALTVVRFALVPAFVVLMAEASGGHSWPAAVVFGVA